MSRWCVSLTDNVGLGLASASGRGRSYTGHDLEAGKRFVPCETVARKIETVPPNPRHAETRTLSPHASPLTQLSDESEAAFRGSHSGALSGPVCGWRTQVQWEGQGSAA